nr:uncharacterized protein C16orf92 homolog isoform X5 [Macaca nemestrina]
MIAVMRLWPWVLVWVWLAAIGAIDTVPRPKRATASALGTESPRFLDRPDFFDYPDSDQARLLAVAQFIGEKPIMFVNSETSRKGPKELDRGPGLNLSTHTHLLSCR